MAPLLPLLSSSTLASAARAQEGWTRCDGHTSCKSTTTATSIVIVLCSFFPWFHRDGLRQSRPLEGGGEQMLSLMMNGFAAQHWVCACSCADYHHHQRRRRRRPPFSTERGMEENSLVGHYHSSSNSSSSSTAVITSNPDELLTRTPPALPSSPSGSLRFARPPRPRSRSNRRHSLVDVFPSSATATGNGADDPSMEPTIGMQRSASYAPHSSKDAAKDEGGRSSSRPRRPMSYHAGAQRNLFAHEAQLRLQSVAESAASIIASVKEAPAMMEAHDDDDGASMAMPTSGAEPNVAPDVETESMESNVVKDEPPSPEDVPGEEYSFAGEDTPSFAAMMADMIAAPTASPLLPVVSPVNGLSILVDATSEEEEVPAADAATDPSTTTTTIATAADATTDPSTMATTEEEEEEEGEPASNDTGDSNDHDSESDFRISYDNAELAVDATQELSGYLADNTAADSEGDTAIKEIFADMNPEEDDSDSNAEVPAVIGMLSPERVRDSVLLQAEKSPQLLALRNIDAIDAVLPSIDGGENGSGSGSGSNSDDDIASLNLPGVLNPANLVVDEALPPKSPLLGNTTDAAEEEALETVPPIDDLPHSVAGEAAEPATATTVTAEASSPDIDPATETDPASATAASSSLLALPGSPAVVPTEMIPTIEGGMEVGAGHGDSAPLVYETTGSANVDRQMLIARLCSIGHSEAAANDALDALPKGNFDQLLLWISRRRLAVLKSDVEEEKRLRRLEEELEWAYGHGNNGGASGGLRGQSMAGLGISSRLSDTGSEDSAMLLSDVHLIDRTASRDPMHRPPDPRTTPRPRSILKTSPNRSGGGGGSKEGRLEGGRELLKETTMASLWQRSRVWFSMSTRLSAAAAAAAAGTPGGALRKETFHRRQGNSLRTKQSPYAAYLPGPPSPSLSVESDELPTRQLKQVRFPVQGMAIKYLYVAERPIQPGLRLDEHGRTVDGRLVDVANAVGESAELLSQKHTQHAHDSLEALASSTQIVGDGPPRLLSLADAVAPDDGSGSGARSPISPTHASTLHPATKSEAQAAITIDAALAAGAPRDAHEDASTVPAEEVHLHTARELSVYYRQACRARDERPIESIVQQLKRASERGEHLTTLSLNGILLERRAADALSDMLALRSGLQRLELDSCSLVNDALKSILHSLLLVDELQELSLCRNKRISADGFKYIAIYTRKAKNLRLLDLSGCRPDKRGCRYLSHALASSSVMMLRSALRTLYLDDCNLRSTFLEVLVPSIRRSNVTELSLKDNRFGPNGAIWIAALLDADWLPPDESNGLFTGIESRIERLNLACNDIRTENNTLACLNLSGNPVSGPTMDGIMQLRASLTFNNTLHTLLLADTDMRSEGAIALAEFLPETQTLRRLDLSDNPDIDIAGVMALSVSVRMNKSLQYLDVNPDDSEMAALSRDILLTCIRNTQLQEESARKDGHSVPSKLPPRRSSRVSIMDASAAVVSTS
ncbi:hypothetical protein SYNPS1DRAFT_26693 [Syncephalis pseudoplumigaleata]|uniref:RNI-like protein n=1 Tax=Syncephalis pseudoplumigaleata TaxID=1712513 RepID=A0A4P9Z588_9FUNG|nr:hypothetical protein SYNPS1DRAFT_26693 [Syncephalis pseudoplumigaleata]|eukprot:RKP27665.1 hypothetical protein SYNPS1DRAFT_26693 [Syncephalis pseudoplumigaleata]